MSISTTLPDDAVDAIVVGSGAAGSAMAALLAEGGKRVLILEAGPARGTGDLVSSTLFARRLKWSGAPVIEEGKNPISHVFNAGYGVGGSALHHYAVWPRLHEEDFEMHKRYQRGLDWPLSYQELAPYYDRVQREAGVSGDAEKEVWRPPGEPYPMPPVPVFPQGEAIARGFAKLGKKVAPLPLAINTATYNGRTPCIWDGWCDAGCPIGALSYPKLTHTKSGAFGSYQWIIAQAVKPNDLLGISTSRADLFGAELHSFMKRASRGFATMTAVCEGLPVADNRVTLADKKDERGTPLARLTHSSHAESAALWEASVKEGKAIIEAAGAPEVWNNPPGSMHIMGGTTMGRSRTDSVTNSFGQLHDMTNLVVAGPGLFPTSGGVNPTFTVHAVTARSAEHLLANWNKITA